VCRGCVVKLNLPGLELVLLKAFTAYQVWVQ
jgi:hypothetical protein